MTEEEFLDKWSKLLDADKRFIETYLEHLDIYQADTSLGEGTSQNSHRVRARERWARTKDVIFYIMKRDGYLTEFFNKFTFKKHFMRLFEEAQRDNDREFQFKILKEIYPTIAEDCDDSTVKQSKEVVIKFD